MDEERLKQLIEAGGATEFTETFLQWMEHYDDTDISCMSDVISTLADELEEDLSRGCD